MQQRYYDPVVGRFYSNDPVGFMASNPMMFNRYAYANNNPYKYTDPDGRSSKNRSDSAAQLGILAGELLGVIEKNGDGMRTSITDGKLKSDGLEKNKRGPKTGGAGAHNEKIKQIGEQATQEGHTVVAGGGVKPEKLIPTPGGAKSGRRPDVIIKDKDTGELRGVNVGRTKADGTAIKREQEAASDLNNHSDLPTTFVPYDRPN